VGEEGPSRIQLSPRPTPLRKRSKRCKELGRAQAAHPCRNRPLAAVPEASSIVEDHPRRRARLVAQRAHPLSARAKGSFKVAATWGLASTLEVGRSRLRVATSVGLRGLRIEEPHNGFRFPSHAGL